MSSSPTPSITRIRLCIAFLSILGLVFAILNSAIARFAVMLRLRAQLGITESDNAIMAHSFQQVMGKVLGDVLIAALASALSVIVGFIILLVPRWLHKSSNVPFYNGAMQLILSLVILVTGAYLAIHVYGFQSSFAGLQGNDRTPYYSVMYYCGIGEAIYGALMILIGVGSFFMFLKFGN